MSDKKLFKGVRYEVECSSGFGDSVAFQSAENGAGVVNLVVAVCVEGETRTVHIAPENLTEAFTAIVAAFGTTATEGLKRAEKVLSPWEQVFGSFGKAAKEGS